MRSTAWLTCFVVLALGCGDGGGDASETTDTGAGTTGSSGSSGTDPAGSSSSGADTSGTSGGDGLLTHGYVRLELARSESQATDPFVGTATVIAVLQYRECLTAFYANNPELRQDGADGAAIFGGAELGGEGWLDRLCEPTISEQIACEVQAIVQDVEIVQQLTIVYEVSGALEGGRLLFGPLPTAATAMCPGGLEPVVRVAATGAVTGNADNGTQLWGTEASDPTEAITNQAAPIRILAAAVGG